MKSTITLIIVAVLLFGQAVSAMDLQTAKTRGLVGETSKGYLAPVKEADPEVTNLVKTINDKRQKSYRKIAQKNGTSLKAVEQLAGKKAMQKSKSGSYIKPGASWKKK